MSTQIGDSDKNGNIKLGENDQGHYGTPGSGITYKEVAFWLMANGDVRAVIDNRYGWNQGYFQQNGGAVQRLTGEDLGEAVELATAHCADDADLTKACRLAASEARATMRDRERETPENPLAGYSDAELIAELERRHYVVTKAPCIVV